MIHLKKNGIGWEVVDGFESQLEPLLATLGRVIKQSPAKLVTVHEYAGTTYYVKRYRSEGIALRSLKYLFKPSQSRHEWEQAQKIEALHVPLVRHLALGERWTLTGLQESILVTEGFDAMPLNTHPAQAEPAVQAGVGKLLRLCHDRGVLQRDLHHNILVRLEPLDVRRVDVHHAVVKPALTEAERLDNLAYLNVHVTLTNACFAGYGWDEVMARRTRERSAVLRRQHLHYRSKRCLKRNSEFAPIHGGWVRLPFCDDKLRVLLDDPDTALASRARLLKRGHTATVGSVEGVVIKRFNFRKLINVLVKDHFRSSRAVRSYRKAYYLELCGIPTARPLATLDKRVLHCLVRSYSFMEEIPGAVELGEYLRTTPRPDRAVVRRVAAVVAQMHDNGFSHRDLKETNLVLDAQHRAYVLDLDGLKYLNKVPRERAVADLQRLARAAAKYPSLTRADRVAFLRAYLGARHVTADALRAGPK